MREGVVILHSHNYGKTAALAEAILRAHEEGKSVIVCKPDATEADIQTAIDDWVREKWDLSTRMEFPTPPSITPTPFTKTTPRQRANKGAKWYTSVRKGRREW